MFLLALLSVAAAAAAGPTHHAEGPLGRAVPAAAAPRCELRTVSSAPIVLRDGWAVSVDVASIAVSGKAVMIAGTPTYVWPGDSAAEARAGDWPRTGFGVVRDARGRFSLVPEPLAPGVARHPRVAAAGRHGWHVLFVQGRGAREFPDYDSATVWYGRYDGARWHDVQPVAAAGSARLVPDASSGLVAHGGELHFAYSFDRSLALKSNAPGNQGVVLLRRRGNGWREDTLRTWEGPQSVRLVETRGGVASVMVQASFERGRVHLPQVFLARVDSIGSAARRALDDSPLYVKYAFFPDRLAPGDAVAWVAAGQGADEPLLRWGVVRRDLTVRSVGALGAVERFDRPLLLRAPRGLTAVLSRDGASRSRLRVAVLRGGAVVSSGVVEIPFDNSAVAGATLPGGKLLIVTGRLGATPREPRAVNVLTELAVRCGAR